MGLLDDALDAAGLSDILDLGRPVPDAVTVQVGTTKYDAWESIKIARGLDTMAGVFSISMVDKWRESKEKWPLVPGERVNVQIGGKPVITGYIDKLDVGVTNDDRSIVITGRDKTGDLIDSSAFADPSTFKNITIESLAKKFATEIFGIKVTLDGSSGLPFDKFTIKQGETVFEMLERAAKLRGLLLISDERGDLVITSRAGGSIGAAPSIRSAGKAATDVFGRAVPSVKNIQKSFDFPTKGLGGKSKVSLTAGEDGNILSAKATYDYTDRYQTYLVKGQSQGTDVFNRKNVTSVSAVARDLAIQRSRVRIILADGSVNKVTAQKRANWEAIVRATKSVDVVVKVEGWFKPKEKSAASEAVDSLVPNKLKSVAAAVQDDDQELWKVNELVHLNARFIGLDTEMLITGVQFNKSISGGTITTLKLTRPDAFDPDKEEISLESDPTRNLGWLEEGTQSVVGFLKDLFT